MRNGAILIPALNPPEILPDYIQELIQEGFKKIIVIDDGSESSFQNIFETIKTWKECVVLKHAVNLGKGRALKTGFNYYLNECPEYGGLITADSDGQHAVKDVIALDDAIKSVGGGRTLILGCRDFNGKNVPPKSRFGNKMTSRMFYLLYGMKISDTQTGLRGFTAPLLKDYLSLWGERFEYETNMLIEVKKKGASIKEIPIETIYINQNSETHFHPVRDSIRIYRLLLREFIRFSAVSLGSFAVDIAVFQLLITLLGQAALRRQIFLATFGARACSSIFNCLLNKSFVFKSNGPIKRIMLRYYMLCVLQMFCSAILVFIGASFLTVPQMSIKICVDGFLFFISYRIQKNYIYR